MTHGNKLPNPEEDVVEQLFDYGAGIQRYIEDGEKNNVLRPHQIPVFHAIQEFMAQSGERRGYVEHPTGGGKTAIFVELSKAILEAESKDGQRPKILVVTPQINLVNQTVGRSGKKGYGKFAPDLKVSTFFSKSTEEDRRSVHTSDVVVTTYDSMNLMTRRRQFEERTPEEIDHLAEATLDGLVQSYGARFRPMPGKFSSIVQQLKNAELELFSSDMRNRPTGKPLFDLFDVYILDEVHHILGETAGRIIETIPKHKPVIGFSATPDANQKRKMESRLPTRIHSFALNEAIGMGVLSPLIPLGVESGVAMAGHDIFDAQGEYLDKRISHLASSAIRNSLIVNIAKVLADAKIGTIVNCLEGDGALHARMLAQQMRTSGIKAEAIHGQISSAQRERIHERFENGETDVLTYVEILGEGWDSQRPKAIINGRPTRSLIIAKQRVGRIERLGNFALSFDIMDRYDRSNPPLFVSDILVEADVDKGTVFGELTPEEQAQSQRILSAIGRVAKLASFLPADYSNFHARLSEYTPIVSGNLASATGKSYSIASSVDRGVRGLSDEILDKLWLDSGRTPDVMEGVSGFTIRRGYERKESEELINAIPNNDPTKALKERDGSQWMSPLGLVTLFGRRYPELNERIMQRIVDESRELLSWKPLRYLPTLIQTTAKPFIYKAYKVDDDSKGLLNKQLNDYFEALQLLESEALPQ